MDMSVPNEKSVGVKTTILASRILLIYLLEQRYR